MSAGRNSKRWILEVVLVAAIVGLFQPVYKWMHRESRSASSTVPAPGSNSTTNSDEAPSAKSPASSPSVLPEEGDHPDYPTPTTAGTQGVFYLEEPPRGPHVTRVELPNQAGLKFAAHANCELEGAGITCSPALSSSSLPRRWRVGRSEGRPVLAQQKNRSGKVLETYVFRWNARGKLVQLAFLDRRGIVRWARTYDIPGERYTARTLSGANALDGCGRNALVGTDEIACQQWSGAPMLDEHGVAAHRLVRDRHGWIVEQRSLGLDGKPVLDHVGVHRTRFARGDGGRILAEEYFGVDDTRALSLETGCYGLRHEFDAFGDLARTTCLGPNDLPAPDQEGITSNTHIRDGNGCIVETRHQDASGGLVGDSHGVAIRAYRENPECLDLQVDCRDDANQPRPCDLDEPSRYVHTYDTRGRLVSTKHFDSSGNPSSDPSMRAFELRRRWDQRDNPVSVSCHGVDGQPIDCGNTGFHMWRAQYDDAGRETEKRFVGTEGAPVSNLGTFLRRFSYDNYDHLFEARELTSEGEPVSIGGMSSQRRLYDSAHREFAVLLHDPQGAAAQYTYCFTGMTCPDSGWHAVRIVRAENGKVVRNLFFNAAHQLVTTIDCSTSKCLK